MSAVLCAFRHPACEQRLLVGRQRLVRIGRRHHVFVVGRQSGATNELTLRQIPWSDDGEALVERLQQAVARVEAELRLALARVWAVAAKAAVGQQAGEPRRQSRSAQVWPTAQPGSLARPGARSGPQLRARPRAPSTHATGPTPCANCLGRLRACQSAPCATPLPSAALLQSDPAHVAQQPPPPADTILARGIRTRARRAHPLWCADV